MNGNLDVLLSDATPMKKARALQVRTENVYRALKCITLDDGSINKELLLEIQNVRISSSDISKSFGGIPVEYIRDTRTCLGISKPVFVIVPISVDEMQKIKTHMVNETPEEFFARVVLDYVGSSTQGE